MFCDSRRLLRNLPARPSFVSGTMNTISHFALFLLAYVSAIAQITSPEPGTPQRKAILDALRPPLNALAGRSIKFLYPNIRVSGEWAWVRSQFVAEDGKPLPQNFDLNYVGLAHFVNDRWELGAWRQAIGDEATEFVRKECPSAPEILFNETSDVSKTASSQPRGFYVDGRGIPVISLAPMPRYPDVSVPPIHPKQLTVWPHEGHGLSVVSVGDARVWEKSSQKSGNVIVTLVFQQTQWVHLKANNENRELKPLWIQLQIPADMSAFFIPYSVDRSASWIESIHFNHNGEITEVKFWYTTNGFEVSDTRLVINGTAYSGDNDKRILVKASFTPDDLESLKPDNGVLDEEVVEVAKVAAKQLRVHRMPFPNYDLHKATAKNKVMQWNANNQLGDQFSSFVFREVPENRFLYGWCINVYLKSSGIASFCIGIGEQGDESEDWLEAVVSRTPVVPPSDSKPKQQPAPTKTSEKR